MKLAGKFEVIIVSAGITDCINYLVEHNHACIEATEDAQDDWVAHVNEMAGKTLLVTCHSWYLGAIPANPGSL